MPRRADIDLAKGLAILLVVFGHLVARNDPQHVGWYEPLRRAVYAFHMPLFLYLSGLTSVLSGTLLRRRAAWPQVLASRAKRLLLPFFGLGGLIVLGKCLLRHFLVVDNAPAGLLPGLRDLFWHTAQSPALSIWYLFVLFVVSLASVGVLDGKPARLPWLLGGCALLYLLPLPAYGYLDRVGEYAVFFVLGAGAGCLGGRWDAFMDHSWPWLLVLFLACLAAIAAFGAHWPEKWMLFPVGVLAMPALHGCLRFSAASSPPGMLLFLGRYSFMIYLFNTLFIGLTKGLLLLLWSWDGANFLPFALALMAAGTLGPVALKRHLFWRSKTLDRLTH
jgi:fucose 4-O-acetylase-like acetyltransferase